MSNQHLPVGITFLKRCVNLSDMVEKNEKKEMDYYSLISSEGQVSKYYVRYGILDSRFHITKAGLGLVESFDHFPDVDLELLSNVFYTAMSGHALWVKYYIDYGPSHYIFEASSDRDSSFIYAKFLFEIGIIQDDPQSIKPDVNDCYPILFTSLGYRLIAYLKRQNQKGGTILVEGITNNIYGENINAFNRVEHDINNGVQLSTR